MCFRLFSVVFVTPWKLIGSSSSLAHMNTTLAYICSSSKAPVKTSFSGVFLYCLFPRKETSGNILSYRFVDGRKSRQSLSKIVGTPPRRMFTTCWSIECAVLFAARKCSEQHVLAAKQTFHGQTCCILLLYRACGHL